MGMERETLVDEICPNCGDDLDLGDMAVCHSCFDCDWRGHVSADTDEILWDKIFKG